MPSQRDMLAQLLGGGNSRFFDAGNQQPTQLIPIGPSSTRAGDRNYGFGAQPGAAQGIGSFGNSITGGLDNAKKAKQGYDVWQQLSSLLGGGGGVTASGAQGLGSVPMADAAGLGGGSTVPGAWGAASGVGPAEAWGLGDFAAFSPSFGGGGAGAAGGAGAGGAGAGGGWLAGLTGGSGLAGAGALGAAGAVFATLPLTLWWAYAGDKEKSSTEKRVKNDGYNGLTGDEAWSAYKTDFNFDYGNALSAENKLAKGETLTQEEQRAWDRLGSRFKYNNED